MPLCVIGMHRSGTSMVTRLLNLCGVYLGEDDQLSPATPHNPDGHWEHLGFQRINEELLNRFGGGWDLPPQFPTDWVTNSLIDDAARQASELTGSFEGREPWGWKDPRTSLTIPFWKRYVSGLRFVVCVRNPLEVAASMRRRGLCSYAMALSLWDAYNRRIIELTLPEERLVCHYDAFFDDLPSAVARFAAVLPDTPDALAVNRCEASVRNDLRHSRFSAALLQAAQVTPDLVELYARLCQEAQWSEPAADPTSAGGGRPWLNLQAMDAEMLRREVAELHRALDGRDRQIESLRHASDVAAGALAKAHQLGEMLHRETIAQRHEMGRLRGSVEALAESVRQSGEILKRVEYQNMVRAVREELAPIAPAGATVAVVSKGDDQLLAPFGPAARHFPRAEDGGYAWSHPAGGDAAVAHLEELRGEGFTHLVLPDSARWWLDAYPEFRRHLESHFPPPHCLPGAGMLFSLLPTGGEPSQGSRA